MEKFHKLKVFNHHNLHLGTQNKYFQVLDQYLPEIFPSETVIKEIIKKHKNKITTYNKNEYISECLPFHLFDNKWLVKYMAKFFAEKKLAKFDIDYLDKYVKSQNFKTACQEFGDRYFKVKLKNMMNSTRANHQSIVDIGFPDISHRVDCDEFFRQHVLINCIIKGFDRHTIEVGLEKNAYIWRNRVMRQTFENLCNLEILIHDFPKSNLTKMQFYRKKHVYRKLWMRYREYEYYRKHHAIIDELGLATNNMKLSLGEGAQLFNAMENAHEDMVSFLPNKLNEEDLEL